MSRMFLAPILLAGALAALGAGAARLDPAGTGEGPRVVRFAVEHAIALAGNEVPDEVESLYFFVLDPANPDEHVELAETLGLAAAASEYVAVSGADPDHNRRVLLAALAVAPADPLDGMVLVYVGPAEHEADLTAAAAARGARVRYVRYEHRADDVI